MNAICYCCGSESKQAAAVENVGSAVFNSKKRLFIYYRTVKKNNYTRTEMKISESFGSNPHQYKGGLESRRCVSIVICKSQQRLCHLLQLNQFSQMCGEVVNGLVLAVKVFTALNYYNTL